MKYIHVNTEATERSEHGEVTVETGVNTGELIQEVILNASIGDSIVGAHVTLTLSHVTRKPVCGSYGQLRHKPACSADETS